MEINERIAKLRENAGMSQNQLAKELHVTRQAVSRWENGVGLPEMTIMRSIAELFGVSVDYILGTDYAVAEYKCVEAEAYETPKTEPEEVVVGKKDFFSIFLHTLIFQIDVVIFVLLLKYVPKEQLSSLWFAFLLLAANYSIVMGAAIMELLQPNKMIIVKGQTVALRSVRKKINVNVYEILGVKLKYPLFGLVYGTVTVYLKNGKKMNFYMLIRDDIEKGKSIIDHYIMVEEKTKN